MDNIELDWKDEQRVENWHNCLKEMIRELKQLEDKHVDDIFKKYKCQFVDYGKGLNLEWPNNG